jgi:hypothetical protein
MANSGKSGIGHFSERRKNDVRLQIENDHVGGDRVDVDANHFSACCAADKFDGKSAATVIGDMGYIRQQFRD